MAIVSAGTRLLIDAVFGSDRIGETSYSEQLITSGVLREVMLLFGGRNFASSALFAFINQAGA